MSNLGLAECIIPAGLIPSCIWIAASRELSEVTTLQKSIEYDNFPLQGKRWWKRRNPETSLALLCFSVVVTRQRLLQPQAEVGSACHLANALPLLGG